MAPVIAPENEDVRLTVRDRGRRDDGHGSVREFRPRLAGNVAVCIVQIVADGLARTGSPRRADIQDDAPCSGGRYGRGGPKRR
jgi:hypothetical protein